MARVKRALLTLLAALALLLSAASCGAPHEPAQPSPEPSPSAEPEKSESDVADKIEIQEPPASLSAEKADYLHYKFAYSISGVTQGDALAETAEKECAENYSRENGTADISRLMRDWIYEGVTPTDYSCGAVFLTWSAEYCGLIDCGAFLRSTDLRDIYDHFTKVNEFAAKPLNKSTQFGGTEYNVRLGDILFWVDNEGVEINAGIVTQARGGKIIVAVCSSDSKVASFEMDRSQKDEDIVKKCILVEVLYPCNEQLTFLYLVNELGYTNAIASGVMANIYCESLFRPELEEVDFGEGYGLCQWTGARRAALEMWCAANSLDHSKLQNQLDFMKKELETNIPGDLDWKLRRLGNSEEDAVKAGKLWCELFENPMDEEANQRGELAKVFFEAYSGHPYI